jgi:hypothetical protein
MASTQTFTIEEAKRFFFDNPPKQFQLTDETGKKLHAWKDGTKENISKQLENLKTNDVFSNGFYLFRTRTSPAPGAHLATFYISKGEHNKSKPMEEGPKKKEDSALDAVGTSELLNIISENKILRFKVETLEKTIEHLNHEIDSLEEQIEEGHHAKGMNEGLVSALLPLGDRLLNIIEARTTKPLSDIGAKAPAPAPVQNTPVRVPTVAIDPRKIATRQAPPPVTQAPTPAGGTAPLPSDDVEQITAVIIERIENDPDNPNALAQQMEALLKQRPDIYENVANLLTAYFANQ